MTTPNEEWRRHREQERAARARSQMETEHVAKCKRCGAEIVFLRTKAKKLMPVDAATVNRDDYQYERSKHRSHFETCPQAEAFRR